MATSSFTQVETFGFKPLRDPSPRATSIDLFDLQFGAPAAFSSSAPGCFPARVRLSTFTIALRKQLARSASLSTA